MWGHQGEAPARRRHLQTLALRAALDPEDGAARAAWHAWANAVDPADVDPESHRLLPVLSARLPALGLAGEPLAAQLARSVRLGWLRTAAVLRGVAPGLRALDAAGVRWLLIKGAALPAHLRRAMPPRPMGDVDVLVSRADAGRAATALQEAGFVSPLSPHVAREPTRVIEGWHAIGFEDPAGAGVDVHWHALPSARRPGDAEAAWDGAVPARAGIVEGHAAALEEVLVGLAGQLARWTPEDVDRHVADVALLLADRRGDLDWDRVVRRARELRVGPATARALTIAAGVLRVELPPGVVRDLRRGGVLRRLLERRQPDGAPAVPGRLRTIALALDERAEVLDPAITRGPAGAVRLLATVRGVARAADLPADALHAVLGSRRATRDGLLSAPPPAAAHVPAVGGEPVVARLGGHGLDALRQGWWSPEPHGTWSKPPRSTCVLRSDLPAGAGIWVDVELAALLAPRRPALDVDLLADGVRVARWRLTATGPDVVERAPDGYTVLGRTADVPAGILRGGDVVLTFVVARGASPAALRVSGDLRQLGIALRRLRVVPSGAVGALVSPWRSAARRPPSRPLPAGAP